MQKIGFATEFYTLWDVTEEPKYFTDSYGNHWLQEIKTYYGYIQNISKDLATVKAKYPDLDIDEDLRGKNRSWSRTTQEDLTPHILKFGKYSGKPIAEVAEFDFGYILWLLENGRSETKRVCYELPKVIEHFAEVERKKQEAMESHPIAESGEVEITFLSNPNWNVQENLIHDADSHNLLIDFAEKNYAEATIGEGNKILVIFDEVKYVGGMYPYFMGVVNGKAMRIKGKTMKLNLNIIHTNKSEWCALQTALIRK